MKNIYEAQSANKRKSAVVVVFFVIFITLTIYIMLQAFTAYIGSPPGGLGVVGIALIISGLLSLGGYYYSDTIVLKISKARPSSREKDFNFYTVAENMSIASGLPKPKLYVIDDTAMNAFATGRDPDHAVVCATRGLLDNLNRTELEGVIAHELSHIKNYDTRLMSVVAVLVGSVALLGDMFLRMSFYGRGGKRSSKNNSAAILIILGLVFAILSPIIARLIRLAISRRREFLADASSVAVTRQPSGLISALQKISKDTEPLEVANKATAHLYIANPFKKKTKTVISKFSGMFNTHPPVTERIKQLQSMS